MSHYSLKNFPASQKPLYRSIWFQRQVLCVTFYPCFLGENLRGAEQFLRGDRLGPWAGAMARNSAPGHALLYAGMLCSSHSGKGSDMGGEWPAVDQSMNLLLLGKLQDHASLKYVHWVLRQCSLSHRDCTDPQLLPWLQTHSSLLAQGEIWEPLPGGNSCFLKGEKQKSLHICKEQIPHWQISEFASLWVRLPRTRSYAPEYERHPHLDFPVWRAVHVILHSHNPRLLFFFSPLWAETAVYKGG